jgi:glycine/D-amino acid oxidase-like deaminating enzyme
MVCAADAAERLRHEFGLLQSMGVECEWWNEERVAAAHGAAAGFVAGIYFPRDGIIDSSKYAQALVAAAVKLDALEVGPRIHTHTRTHTHTHTIQSVHSSSLARFGSTRLRW